MTGAHVEAVAQIAAIACSGAPVEERLQEVMERLRKIIPFDGAAASRIEPSDGRPRMLVNAGYPAHVADHVSSLDYHQEVVIPWALPRRGWPVRERDLGIDPMTLRCNVEYFRPAGLLEGLALALTTPDGRFVGALDVSVSDPRHPSDDACALLARLAPMLANLMDPLQSAESVATLVGGRACQAVALLADGSVAVLRGSPDRALLDAATDCAGDGPAGPGVDAFLWQRGDGGLDRCRILRCRDGVRVLVIDEPPDLRGLTARELEVLTCLVDGLSNAEIARRLWIAERTARAHVEHILRKLGVSTRAAAVATAVQEGWVLPAQSGAAGGEPLPAAPGAHVPMTPLT